MKRVALSKRDFLRLLRDAIGWRRGKAQPGGSKVNDQTWINRDLVPVVVTQGRQVKHIHIEAVLRTGAGKIEEWIRALG